MSKITKKISINAFENVMKNTYTKTKTAMWNDIEITITPTLSLEEYLGFVRNVLNGCFSQDGETYLPEAKGIAIRTNILEKYANFKMPESLSKQYDLLYCTDAVDFVLQHINCQQFENICSTINEKIEYQKKTNIDAVNRKIEDLSATIDAVSQIFSNFSTDDVKAAFEAAKSANLTEEAIVREYLAQKDKSE